MCVYVCGEREGESERRARRRGLGPHVAACTQSSSKEMRWSSGTCNTTQDLKRSLGCAASVQVERQGQHLIKVVHMSNTAYIYMLCVCVCVCIYIDTYATFMHTQIHKHIYIQQEGYLIVPLYRASYFPAEEYFDCSSSSVSI